MSLIDPSNKLVQCITPRLHTIGGCYKYRSNGSVLKVVLADGVFICHQQFRASAERTSYQLSGK